MFEVGKYYGGTPLSSNYKWLCIAVDGNRGWLKPVGYAASIELNIEGIIGFHEGWKEFPPQPKRWNTWQNVYARITGPVRKTVEQARERQVGSCLSTLRRDFEQHEGKEAVCVNIELVKTDGQDSSRD